MARKSKIATDHTNKQLGISDLRNRLNFLEKENSKLIKQIETSRTKLINLNNSIKEVGIQINQRVAPFRNKMLELDTQIHAAFQEIFTGRKLGKKSRKDIETVYNQLQSDGLISSKSLPIEHLESDTSENDDDDDEPNDRNRSRSHQQILEDLPKPDRDELKKIRQLFLRLADNFHPDKVTDEAEKEYRTEIMKEINLAYQDGDLARLLAIEKQQEVGVIIDRDSSDELTRHCAKVEAENTYLKEQLETLKRQLKLTKRTQQGEMTAFFKKITKYGGDPMDEALHNIEHQIEMVEQIQQFVVDFRDRRITVNEFLQSITNSSYQSNEPQEIF